MTTMDQIVTNNNRTEIDAQTSVYLQIHPEADVKHYLISPMFVLAKFYAFKGRLNP